MRASRLGRLATLATPLVFALVLPWACFGGEGEADTRPCEAALSARSAGFVPPGALLNVLVLSRRGGATNTDDERCARWCSAKVQVVFDSALATAPQRFYYDFARAGWTAPPEAFFVRTGVLRSRCDDPDPGQLGQRIEDRGSHMPGEFVYEDSLVLQCVCGP